MLERGGQLYLKVGGCSKGKTQERKKTLSPGKPDSEFEVRAIQGPQLQLGEKSVAVSKCHEDIEAGFDFTIPSANGGVDDINVEGWSGADIGLPCPALQRDPIGQLKVQANRSDIVADSYFQVGPNPQSFNDWSGFKMTPEIDLVGIDAHSYPNSRPSLSQEWT